MLPNSSTRTPSAVSAGSSRSVSSRAARCEVLLGFVPIAGQGFLVGLQDHQAMVAVDDHQVAAGDVGQKRPVPTTAGISSPSATIAVWLPGPPTSVANPRTNCAVEIGRFAGREIVRQHHHRRNQTATISSRRRPSKLRSSRFSISKISLARSAR